MSDTVVDEFEWNTAKAARNLAQHGVSFEEAMTVIDDPNAIIQDDRTNHEHFIAIGCSDRSHVLFVVACERRGGRVRIVSARQASPAQVRAYEG